MIKMCEKRLVCGNRCRVVGCLFGAPGSLDPSGVALDLLLTAVCIPPQRLAHQLGDAARGDQPAIRRFDGDMRAALKHVWKMERALVAGGVKRLDLQILRRALDWPPERRATGEQREDLADQRAVASQQMVDLARLKTGCRGQPLALVLQD